MNKWQEFVEITYCYMWFSNLLSWRASHTTVILLDALSILFSFSGNVRGRASSSSTPPWGRPGGCMCVTSRIVSSPAVLKKQHQGLLHPAKVLVFVLVPQLPWTPLLEEGSATASEPQERTFSPGLGFSAASSDSWSTLRGWVVSITKEIQCRFLGTRNLCLYVRLQGNLC